MTMKSELKTGEGIYVGFDIGSVSLNTVILNESMNLIDDFYEYVHGKPFNVLRNRLNIILTSGLNIKGLAYTGTGGKLGVELTGGAFVNEIIAQATS